MVPLTVHLRHICERLEDWQSLCVKISDGFMSLVSLMEMKERLGSCQWESNQQVGQMWPLPMHLKCTLQHAFATCDAKDMCISLA